MGREQGILARYIGSDDVLRGIIEPGGDVWVESTDRESVRLRLGVLSPLVSAASDSQPRSPSFWDQTHRVGRRIYRERRRTRSRSVMGRAGVGGLGAMQTHTLTQATYLVDTFFSGGLTLARVGLVRSLVLGGGVTGCDYEGGQPEVPIVSLAAQFRAAPGLEREMAEMRDRTFAFHPNARFLLLDYGVQHGADRYNRLG